MKYRKRKNVKGQKSKNLKDFELQPIITFEQAKADWTPSGLRALANSCGRIANQGYFSIVGRSVNHEYAYDRNRLFAAARTYRLYAKKMDTIAKGGYDE